jgi:pimeloyl-ACP methyl ester carboxylesterase
MRALLLTALLALGPWSALAGPVSLTTEDGTAIHAVESGSGSRGVLLLHDKDRTSADWRLFAEKLADKGFRVLALDLRGHGESASITQADPDWEAMPHDVRAGIAHLRARGAREIAIVGAGLGANLAVQVASQDAQVASLVLLSPGLNIKGFKPSKAVVAYGERPLLLVAGAEDGLASNTVRYLVTQARGPRRDVLLAGGDRGTDLLDAHPDLEYGMLSWLAGNHEDPAITQGSDAVQTGEVETFKSQGKRFGEE